MARILAFKGDSHVEWFEGNYQDYERDYRKPRKGLMCPGGAYLSDLFISAVPKSQLLLPSRMM